MSRPSPRDEVLRAWCEAATAKAEEASGRSDLTWERGDEGIHRFHCPNPSGGHQWQGDDPSAWAVLKDGLVSCGCRKCAPKGSGDEDAYTAEMKELLAWVDPDPAKAQGVEVLRWHDFDTYDAKFVIRHTKLKRAHGNAQPYWGWSVKDAALKGFFEAFYKFGKDELKKFKEKHYGGLKHTYNIVQFYQHERFRRQDGHLKDVYRVVMMEGAKDAERWNALMAAAGKTGLVATALPHQTITDLADHQKEVLAGKPLILVGDNDPGGLSFVEHWSAAAWDVASSVKVWPRELFGTKVVEKAGKRIEQGRDFTEWTHAEMEGGATEKVVVDRILAVLTATPELDEPLAQPKAWLSLLKKAEKTGTVLATAVVNGKVIWTAHPDLAGRVTTNSRSGEVEVDDPPWGTGKTVGAVRAARTCSIWLHEEYDRYIAPRTLEEALGADGVAPMRNPLGDLLDEIWDGVPRLDGLFTHYLPLKVEQAAAVTMARLFMGDLVAKLAGRLVPQRILVAIHTDEPVDVAGALMGPHGVHHRGRVEMRQVAQFARQEAAVVQISTEPVVDRNMARGSVAHLFASDIHQPHGRISSPLFIAVGGAGPTLDSAASSYVDERVLILEPVRELQVDALRAEAGQLVAEAVARKDELAGVPVVKRSELRTVDQEEVDENLVKMLRMIHQAHVYEVNHPEEVMRLVLAPMTFPRRTAPREFISRDWFMTVFQPALIPEWRDRASQEKIFNRACRRMGFIHSDGKVLIRMTQKQADLVGLGGLFLGSKEGTSPQIKMPGVRIDPNRAERLLDVLVGHEVPKWGLVPKKSPSYPPSNSLNEKDSPHSPPRPNVVREEIDSAESNSSPYARAHAGVLSKKAGPEKENNPPPENSPGPIIGDAVRIEARSDGDGWRVLVDGAQVNPDAVAEELRGRYSWDPAKLMTTRPKSLLAWLGEVGVEVGDQVEVEDVG